MLTKKWHFRQTDGPGEQGADIETELHVVPCARRGGRVVNGLEE